METLRPLSCLAEYYELPLQEIHKALKVQETFSVQKLLFSIEEMYIKTKNIHSFKIDLTNFVNSFIKNSYPEQDIQFQFSKQLQENYINCYPLQNNFPYETSESCFLLEIIPYITWDNYSILKLFNCLEHKRKRFDIYKHIVKDLNIPYFEEVISKWENNEHLPNRHCECFDIMGYPVVKYLCSKLDTDFKLYDNNLLILQKYYSYYKIQAFIYTLEHIFNDKRQPRNITIEVKKKKNIIYVSATSLMDGNSNNKHINNKIIIFNNFGFYYLFNEYEAIPFLKNNNNQHSNQTHTYNYRIDKKNRFDIYNKFIYACKNMNNEDRELFIQNLKVRHEQKEIKNSMIINNLNPVKSKKRL